MWTHSLLFTVPLALALTVVTAARTRRLCARSRRKILIALLCFFVFSELFKQTIALYTHTHTAAYYPFHYSTTYYFSIALYLSKKPHRHQLGACTLYVGGALLFLCMLFAPYAVVGDTATLFSSWFSIHSFFYHIFVLFAFFTMLFNREYTPHPLDAWRYLAFLLCWGSFALPAAHAYRANYAGLLHSFIGALERFRVRFGDAAYLALYLALAMLFAWGTICLWQRIEKRGGNAGFRASRGG